jgi:hypothetical protein
MIVLGIILGVILLIVAMIGVGGSIQDRNRRARCKNWKIGDKLILNRGNEYYETLQNKHKKYAVLEGWSLSDLYINCGDGFVSKVNWSVLNTNKSANWRQNYDEAKEVMGCAPNFSSGIGEDSESTGKKVDGKPIDLMNEIECEVYLKQALENEDYDTAELIKKRMEKFR